MANINRNILNLELDLLRTFVAVADKSTFAAAAASVCRTQSAVSQQMQRLEQLIGKELFVRHGRNKALTEQGIQMLGYARKILRLNDEACMSLMYDSVGNALHIGSQSEIGENILQSLLSRVSNNYPSLSVDVDVQESSTLFNMLRNGEIDMAVSTQDLKEFTRVRFRTSPVMWYCAHDYPIHFDEPVSLIVFDEQGAFHSAAVEHLRRAGLKWRVAYSATTLTSAKAALKAGLGVMVHSVDLYDGGLRILTSSEGFPHLPDVHYYIYMNEKNPRKLPGLLFESISDERVVYSSAQAENAYSSGEIYEEYEELIR